MAKFSKKLNVIDAIQFDGKNFREIDVFCGSKLRMSGNENELLNIQALGDTMLLFPNDWLTKNEYGQYKVYKPDTFENTFDEA